MNLAAGIPLLASLVALSLPAAAQEKSPGFQTEERLEAVGDGHCPALRMPGIAESSEQYDTYVSEHCPVRSSALVEASTVIRDAGMAYRKFLKTRGE